MRLHEAREPTGKVERLISGQGSDRHLTDLGNAELLVEEHGRDLRYCPSLGWLCWDGRRWRRDADGEVMRRAKRTVRGMLAEAARIEGDKERQALVKHAQASESEARLRAAVSLAESERPVVVPADQLDADPWLLNVTNGTLDLRSAELREHRRDDHLTKLSAAVYEPEARHPVWDAFIERAVGGDGELTAFLRRAVGYSLTGDTSEEVLFFAHGPTGTGKSSFLEAVKAALGEYAATADFDTFLRRRGDPGVRNDVARLAGARLVISVEVDEGKHLAEGLLKLLTGGDTVAARFLYRETFEFQPQLKLWLAANARPRVNADDDAVWRRIVQVPFVEQIPEAERDPALKRRLQADPEIQSAVLAWAVRGCLEWREQGIAVPARVRDYTDEYRHEVDPLAEWVAECCVLGADLYAFAADLRADYERWTERNGDAPLAPRTFGVKLRTRGFRQDRLGHDRRRAWRGIALRAEEGA